MKYANKRTPNNGNIQKEIKKSQLSKYIIKRQRKGKRTPSGKAEGTRGSKKKEKAEGMRNGKGRKRNITAERHDNKKKVLPKFGVMAITMACPEWTHHRLIDYHSKYLMT